MVDVNLNCRSAGLTPLPVNLIVSPIVFVILCNSQYVLSNMTDTTAAGVQLEEGGFNVATWNHSEQEVPDERKTWSTVVVNWSTTSFPEDELYTVTLPFDDLDFNYTSWLFSPLAVQRAYTWDKTIPPIDFQQSYCPLRCDQGVLVRMHDIDDQCPDIACLPCSCLRPACEVYQICCPDVSEPFFPPPQTRAVNFDLDASTGANSNQYLPPIGTNSDQIISPNISFLEQAQPFTGTTSNQVMFPPGTSSYQVSSPSGQPPSQDVLDTYPETPHPTLFCKTRSHILTIRSCPKDVSMSPEVVHKCESDLTTEETTLESIALVTDNLTNVVYYNTFCAQCNRASKPLVWAVQAKCKNYMKVYRARSQDELMVLVQQGNSDCIIEQTPPSKAYLMGCLDTIWLRCCCHS